MDTFQYLPLQEGDIRLLELEAGELDSAVRARLLQYPLIHHRRPVYEALSYVWGTEMASTPFDMMPEVTCDRTADYDSPGTERILNDSQDHRSKKIITSNLEIALRKLRRKSTSRLLWIDALCIDQTNDTEKGSQVCQMRSIYKEAEQVVVFLGENACNSSLLLRLFEESFEAEMNPELLIMFANRDRSLMSRLDPEPKSRIIEAYAADEHWSYIRNRLETSGQAGESANTGLNIGGARFTLLDNLIYGQYSGKDREICIPKPMVEEIRLALKRVERPSPNIFDAGDYNSAYKISANREIKRKEWKMPKALSMEVKRHFGELEDFYQSFIALLARPWFQRVWVLQEAVVARKLLFQCGDCAVSWLSLRHAVFSLTLERVLKIHKNGEVSISIAPTPQPVRRHTPSEESRAQESLPISEGSRLLNIALAGEHMFKEMTKKKESVLDDHLDDLLDLLWQFRFLRATRSRDHIFALLGFAKVSEDTLIKPDYTKPLVEIVVSCGKYCIETDPNPIRILYMAREFSSDSQGHQTKFPSWMPDWFCDGGDAAFDNENYGDSYHFLRKYADIPQNYYKCFNTEKCAMRVELDTRSLSARGLMFDKIRIIGKDHWSKTDKAEYTHVLRLRRWVDEANAFLSYLEHYPTGEGASDVLRKTLVGNRRIELFGLDTLLNSGEGEQSQGGPQAYVQFRMKTKTPHLDPTVWKLLSRQSNKYWSWCESLAGLKYCITKKGYFGLIPLGAQVGDHVCCIAGSCVPFVMREQGQCIFPDAPAYKLLGKCYIHGIMEGELMALRDLERTNIHIV